MPIVNRVRPRIAEGGSVPMRSPMRSQASIVAGLALLLIGSGIVAAQAQ
jgi:hypothetical protein